MNKAKRNVVIAGNWKMNMTPAQTTEFITTLAPMVAGMDGCKVVLCVPYVDIAAAVAAAEGTNIEIGAENVHMEAKGAYTGEISGEMLAACGVKYVIVGHSERRQYFGETNETVNKRLKAALAAGFTPIVCVGELLEERENNKTEAVLSEQIRVGFAGISAEDAEKIVVAYEPVWAIGTGKTATPDMAQAAHAFIRSELRALFGNVADAMRIQYGGSMKASNARELVAQPDIDGGLIGGAALKADDFIALIREALAL